MADTTTTIAIVGAGFSGTLLSLHLLRRCPPTTRIVLIERNRFGRGQAYATPNPSHLLNVPAGRMSAFHDKPSHFLDWLKAQPDSVLNGVVPSAGTFVPRGLFGEYVRSLLNEEIRQAEPRDRLELVRGEVLGIDRSGHPLVLTLDRDRTIAADLAVLAVGNFPPEPMPIADPSFYDTPFYRPDPWAADALTGLDPATPVLLAGTGLTMVDAVITLLDQGHAAPIHAVSRRGLLPRRHAAVPPVAPGQPTPFPTAVRALTRFLRLESERAVASGGSWHAVVDELRPFTVDVWQAMPIEDKKRFLRHLRPWWDVHRHRMAGPVADRIDAARATGQLTVQAGRIRSYDAADGAVRANVLLRGARSLTSFQVGRVVNCAGPGADYDRIQHPLVRKLLDDGTVRPDPLRLGLSVTGACALINRSGAISRRVFAVGPVTKGTFWEMTAVPDIRRQCELLALHLSTLVKSPAGVLPAASAARKTEALTYAI
jgi:uncharacterized NAD(P)/FAD-binding protein YdhS